MSQAYAIFRTLKQTLRQKKVTYRMIAESLDLSESTIKRLFSEQDLTIDRLEKICQLAGMEISDLIVEVESKREFISELSEAQEKQLAADTKLLMITFLVLNGLTYEEMMNHYHLTESELTRYLLQLDHMKLIDLYPENRIRVRVAPSFKWRTNGPIQRFFVEHLLHEFIDCSFSDAGHSFHLLSGLLTDKSIQQLNVGLQRLANEFNECILKDAAVPFQQRKVYSLVLAMRDWRPAIFDPLRNQTGQD